MKAKAKNAARFLGVFFLLLTAQCQTDQDVVQAKGPEISVSKQSAAQVLGEVRNPVLKEMIHKLTDRPTPVQRTSAEDLAYFDKIIKGNEYIVYQLLINDYNAAKPYFEYFVIKQFPDREEAGYVKYTPTTETDSFDIRTFSGKMEMTNLEGGKYGERTFLDGAPVTATEGCEASIWVTVHNCTNGGNHSPEEACAAGYENDGYYEIAIYIHCSVGPSGSIGAPQTLVSVIGGTGGSDMFWLYDTNFINSLSEESSTWWHSFQNADLVLFYNQYLQDNNYSLRSQENVKRQIWSMIHNNGYSGDGPLDDADDAAPYLGPKMSIPETLTLSNGDTVNVTFGTTASDGQSADQEVAVEVVDALKFALEKANTNLNAANKINSIQIAATTNGEHNPNSNHYRGTAIDISGINGKKIVNLGQNAKVQELQEAFDEYSHIRENFGPVFKHKTFPDGTRIYNFNISGHQDHIHISIRN